jgi:hypothetical protein
MKSHNRFFGLAVVLALMSTLPLVLRAQDQDPPQDQVQAQDQDQAQDRDQAPMDQGQMNQGQMNQGQMNQGQMDQNQMDQNQGPPPPNGQGPQAGPQNDPPALAARLQFMQGSVSVQPHGTDDWVAGALNRPLTNSDNIWADKNSRAEINVGSGLIRIDSESSLTLTNVSENAVQLQLHQGAMNLHIRSLDDGETYEVDTPNQAFTVLKPGDYRFDVNPDADTTVITVWRGEGDAAGDGPGVHIRQNEQARFSNGTSMQNQIHAAPSPDGFDQWAESRDGRFDHSASSRYVSPDVVGSEDLDEYGNWQDSPEYGNVWVPSRVDVGWAPYRNGHWIWVAPWGWTWVDDEPWGYAPFHYGRWVYFNNYWGWAPGPFYARPYYAPALVAWFGGGGWGVGVGFGGGYGWCPLGFGEPFIPWYRTSRGYFNRVNITNTHITNITNVYNNTYRGGLHGGQPMHYANMRTNGFTAVSRDTLVNSRSVARNNLRVSASDMSRMSPTRSLDVRPTRTTMLGANAGRTAAMPPARTFARPVVSRNNAASFGGRSAAVPNRGGFNGAGPNTVRANSPGLNSNVRMPDRGPAMSRSVPRPPNAGGMYQGRTSLGGTNPGMDRSNVRPGYNQGGDQRPSYGGGRQSPGYNGSYSRPSPNSGGGYSGRPAPSPSPSYDRGGSYGRPAPAYGGGSYGRSAPSNGGYSSGRSSGSGAYGGGRSSSGGSYGGGGGRSSGGSSGGGHASAPSHSSGGGGGGSSHSSSGGESHGGHH